MKETDLYQPLKHWLEAQGFEVKGEVKNCDVVALRNAEELVIVELKLSLNLSVLLQAADRLLLSDRVYICVPASTGVLKRERKRIVKLLRLIGVGLITVSLEKKRNPVTVLTEPFDYKPRKNNRKIASLVGEFHERIGDPNDGGAATSVVRVTAYRQRAIKVAQYIQNFGPTKASVISVALDDPKVRQLLYNNVYGWFERHGKGIYGLTQKGRDSR